MRLASRSASCVCLLVLPLVALAQAPSRPPGGGAPNQPVAGYKRQTIEGFTVLINQEVIDENAKSTDERKPLEVLEMELKILTRILNPSALKAVRNLLFWVEWNDTEGRMSNAVAVYYGGHQLAMLREGKHPLKANNITVLRMKSLTAEHQPKRDVGRCVLLHEIAHAVHFQLYGRDNPGIKQAYLQAVERKLVDKSAYAATSEAEFFAEMSCAFLDRLHYYPHNRADLEKHDPVTFKLLNGVWGKAKGVGGKETDPRDNEEYPLDVGYERVRFPEPLRGPALDAASLKGKVFLYVYWTPEVTGASVMLGKLQSWYDELSELGLVVAVCNMEEEPQRSKVEEMVKERKTTFTILERRFLDGKHEFRMPHAVLFDAEGKCVYRGGALTGEPQLRAALVKVLLRPLGKDEPVAVLKPALDGFLKSDSVSVFAGKLLALKVDKDETAAAQVKLLLEQLTRIAKKRIAQAEGVMKDEPVTAFVMLEPIPLRFKGTAEATKANELMTALKKNKAVSTELSARTVLTAMQRLDTQLMARPGSNQPTSPEFKRANLGLLQQVLAQAQRAQKFCPGAPSTDACIQIAGKYGLTVP